MITPHNAKHDEYVRLGNCPSIHSSKAWFNARKGHAGKHFALRILPNKRFVIGVEWESTDDWR